MIRNITITILCTLALTAHAQMMQERLDSLMRDEMLNTSQVAVMITDLNDSTTIFSYNERMLMRPASTMKLLTAITALDLLGTEHRFATRLYADQPIEGNILRGNLFVRGGMDPTFDKPDMQALIETLQEMHIDTICGALVEDRSFKEAIPLGEGWCWDDSNPTLSPLPYRRTDGFISALRTQLDEAGIVIIGCDSIGNTPQEATLLGQSTSSMQTVLHKMMKNSDNLYAEAMFYHIGHHQHSISTARYAKQHERDLIARIGFNPDDYRLADGSGLSLYNYVSAELEVALLRYAFENPNIFEALYESLPVAGIDGTLRKRLTDTAAAGMVRAKTGTVTGVSSLAGYAKAASGHMLAFCIINQGILSSKEAKDFQDRLCLILTEQYEQEKYTHDEDK